MSQCKNCNRQIGWLGKVIFPWLHCWVNNCRRQKEATK